MNSLSISTQQWMPALAMCVLGAALPAHAESRLPSVRPSAQPPAPAMVPGVAGTGLPSPSGLSSPSRFPGGLVSRFPAAVPSPLPAPAGMPSPDVPHAGSRGPARGGELVDPGLASSSYVMGASGYVGAAPPSPPQQNRPGPITSLDIAQSFLGADTNRDGELTRAEAQRLTLMPYSFEEMDRNRDGVLTRFEYEDGVR